VPQFSPQDPPVPPVVNPGYERGLDLPEEAVSPSDWDRHHRRVNKLYSRFMNEVFPDAPPDVADDWINPYYAGYLAGFKDGEAA
jgi:hypothetical protein